MKRSSSMLNPLPPRLSMDEYATFVEASIRESDPARAARQKEMEERIQTPFSMAQDTGRRGWKENLKKQNNFSRK